MNILALDTTKKSAHISTIINENLNNFYTLGTENHSESLLLKIDEVLRTENVNLNDIDVFSVVVGPGSFTGIRIGVSFIKAFLFKTDKLCVAVNSFEMLAYNITSALEGNFLVAFNADNRGAYVGEFNSKKELQIIRLFSLEELSSYKKEHNYSLYLKEEEQEYFKDIFGKNFYLKIDEQTLMNLTLEKIKHKNFTGIKELEPLYIKLSQAEDQFREKMLKNLKIEKAYLTDLLELAKLEKDIFKEEAYSENSLKEELTSLDRIVLVAKLNDEIIGYCITLKTPDNMLNILKIATKSMYQKLSVATKIFNELLKVKKEENFEKIFLEVNEHNKPAIMFYKKLGFIESNKRKQYYKDGSDAIIMFL